MLTSTLSGKGHITFTTAFMLFSGREDNVKGLKIFASEKGKIILLTIKIFLFDVFSMTFFRSCQKAAQKSCDILAKFGLSGFSSIPLFFSTFAVLRKSIM